MQQFHCQRMLFVQVMFCHNISTASPFDLHDVISHFKVVFYFWSLEITFRMRCFHLRL